jgi:hypothetical protein
MGRKRPVVTIRLKNISLRGPDALLCLDAVVAKYCAPIKLGTP